MRTFSGITVGVIGAVIGVHYSLALSAAVLFIVISGLLVAQGRRSRAGAMIERAVRFPAAAKIKLSGPSAPRHAAWVQRLLYASAHDPSWAIQGGEHQ